jgi:hypothetical protein
MLSDVGADQPRPQNWRISSACGVELASFNRVDPFPGSVKYNPGIFYIKIPGQPKSIEYAQEGHTGTSFDLEIFFN